MWSPWGPQLSKLRVPLGCSDQATLEMQLDAVIKQVQTCTWRQLYSKFGEALQDCEHTRLEMHLEHIINWLTDICGGNSRVSFNMHWVDIIEQVYTCTWRPWMGEHGDALRGYVWVSFGHTRCQTQARLNINFQRSYWGILEVWLEVVDESRVDQNSVSNGSGLSLRVWVQVQPVPLPNWRSGLPLNPNSQLG